MMSRNVNAEVGTNLPRTGTLTIFCAAEEVLDWTDQASRAPNPALGSGGFARSR